VAACFRPAAGHPAGRIWPTETGSRPAWLDRSDLDRRPVLPNTQPAKLFGRLRPLSDLYILAADGITPVPVDDVIAWGRWFETAERHVAQDMDEADDRTGRKVRVSTVFLGLDHNYSGRGKPVLWETLVFGGPLDGEQDRYTSHAAAFKGHQAMCRRVTESLSADR
jgi:hypothetical protein